MKRLPIVVIQGGLGNQLFQWFYAHSISQESQFSLFLNIPNGPVAPIVYPLGLDPLISNCPHYKEIQKESRNPLRNDLLPRIFDFLWNIPPLSGTLHTLGYFREDPRPTKRAHQIPPKRILYANGYFQKWKYAESQRGAINAEMMPILEETLKYLKSRFDLEQPYTVLHIRRGDYRTDQNPETVIGWLSDKYFIDWTRQHPSGRIILLAEHRSEVEELISAIEPFLVLDNKTTTAWETLAVMSSASVFLGSNSTLSWWGAWTANMNGATTYLPSAWDFLGQFTPSDFLFPGCHAETPIWETTWHGTI
jgi:hypothetical protein